MLLVVQFRSCIKYIKIECAAGNMGLPLWKDFHSEVVNKFPELKGSPYTVKDEDGIEIDEDIFPHIVSPKKKFVIALEEPPKYYEEPPKYYDEKTKYNDEPSQNYDDKPTQSGKNDGGKMRYEDMNNDKENDKDNKTDNENNGEGDEKEKEEENANSSTKRNYTPLLIGLAAVGGAGAAVVAAPLVIAGMGFGAGGVVAGSTAASMMSASGGSVAAGSLVATLQSIGAAGMGAASTGAAATVGGGLSATGAYLASVFRRNNATPDETPNDPGTDGENKSDNTGDDKGTAGNAGRNSPEDSVCPCDCHPAKNWCNLGGDCCLKGAKAKTA